MEPPMSRVDCFYYGIHGNIDHVPAWRHLQTVDHRMQCGELRMDGEWYRRVIRSEEGEPIPALGIWNPETNITVVIVGTKFHSPDYLISEVNSPVLAEQLRQEEWSLGA